MNILSLFDNIFSVKDYGETHRVLRLFGLRIKFPKSEFAKKKRENPYYYYKKNNIDITTIPPATGQIRDIQLANLALLKEFDYVCKQNNIQYWLDAGNLIGAIRHKGFIPWDDDLDVSMIREDYEKIIDAFEKSSRNPDIYAGYVRDKNNNYIIKVQHKKCPHLFVDIFPWDLYGQSLTTEEQLLKTQEIKKIRQGFRDSILSDNDLKVQLDKTMKEQVLPVDHAEHSDLVWGIDYNHQWRNWFTRYEVVYPLKTIEFEGLQVSCMNDNDAFLKRVYGDYMAYPKKLGIGHSMFSELSEEEKKYMAELKEQVLNERK